MHRVNAAVILVVLASFCVVLCSHKNERQCNSNGGTESRAESWVAWHPFDLFNPFWWFRDGSPYDESPRFPIIRSPRRRGGVEA